jgi:hypothetical protein
MLQKLLIKSGEILNTGVGDSNVLISAKNHKFNNNNKVNTWWDQRSYVEEIVETRKNVVRDINT